MKQDILLLGSTGSIGRQTLEVVASLPDIFRIHSMAALGTGEIPLLIEQCRKFTPKHLAIADPQAAQELKSQLSDLKLNISSGPNSALSLAESGEYDLCVAAIAGGAGFLPSLAAAKHLCRLALANKEALVLGGELFMRQAKASGCTILPIDSEHSAIHQCLRAGSISEVAHLILTASGGALRDLPLGQLDTVTASDVLKHPTWKMGPKVTIDSATIMNKGLEIIEAHWLFNLPAQKIKVLIHPQSIVHSMVEFTDGSTIAQLGYPDMRIPIQYALTYPDRIQANWSSLSLAEVSNLSFIPPDPIRYPALDLAYRALEEGGLAAALLSGANEAAVETFLKGECSFASITKAVASSLEKPISGNPLVIDDILAAECEGWQRASVYLGSER